MSVIRGGEKLEKFLAEISRNLSKPATLRVGFLEGSTDSSGMSIPEKAAHNEYGTPNAKHPIPPRPFFRNMIAAKSQDWPSAMGKIAKSEDYDSVKTLAIFGEGVKGQLQQSINEFDSVPLSPVTIARKGFDKQLIDKGDMVNSVASEVKT